MLWGTALSPAFSAKQNDNAALIKQISQLLLPQRQTSETGNIKLRIRVLTPPVQLAELCPTPALKLSGNPVKLTGNRSVIARCGKRQFFIQIHVNAIATYWLATRDLSSGQILSQNDIQSLRGEIDKLPNDILLEPARLLGATPLRMIRAGQPLTANMLRPQWAIKARNEVTLTAPGNGFLIRMKGIALNNAALHDTLRIQTRSGKIIEGIAIGNDKVAINIE
jgi:flagella basal body P-ring formation protein FlgA